jgi:hypothetical protein
MYDPSSDLAFSALLWWTYLPFAAVVVVVIDARWVASDRP